MFILTFLLSFLVLISFYLHTVSVEVIQMCVDVFNQSDTFLNLIFMVPYILVIKVLLKFQIDVFYLFICRLYMFRTTPIFRSFKCTLQTIGMCTSFDVLFHWIRSWLGHRTFITVRFQQFKSDCDESAKVSQPRPDPME